MFISESLRKLRVANYAIIASRRQRHVEYQSPASSRK